MDVQMSSSEDTTSAPRGSRPNLACERCKLRKIKCDRAIPKCRTCLKTSRECSYPLISNKPGPKPGAHHRRKANPGNTPSNTSPVNYAHKDRNHIVSPPIQVEAVTPASFRLSEAEPARSRSPSRGIALSQLLQLSHEPFQQSTTCTIPPPPQSQNHHLVIENICIAFDITPETYKSLVTAYFDNMTSFSLLHRPSFDAKISSISFQTQYQALLASMFSFSARFANAPRSRGSGNISPRQFYDIAERLTENAMRECSDEVPPLCLLQTLILVTFQQLTEGVRGRAWRSMGTLVRIAHELQLHQVDKTHPASHQSNPNPSLFEEKRRAWWAIWEFDVFASTIRRLPTAIDWNENETWLPVDDETWFANKCMKSCNLDPDPILAWKALEGTGNTSPKAWFIIVNALMRRAHLLSYPQAYSTRSPLQSGEVPDGLDLIANSLYCLSAALPPGLSYRGDFLRFSTGSLQIDSARHGIHIMTQLSRFMINHYQVFNSTSRRLGEAGSSSSSALTLTDQSAWNHYLDAASEITTLIRNSPPHHVQYTNPFLASTVWLAAAAQVVSKSFGSALVDSRTAESNLDVLRSNLNSFVSYWGVSDTLKHKLGSLEQKLQAFDQTAESDRRQAFQDSQASTDVQRGTTSVDHAPSVPMQPSNSWAANNGTFASNLWPVPGFEIQSSSLGPDVSMNLWGWGIDELMTYGGVE